MFKSDEQQQREWEESILTLYEILAVLHKRGYQKLRVVPSLSPSGCHYRMFFYPKYYAYNNDGLKCNIGR